MKALKERLADRKEEYENIVKAEHLVESYLEKITPLFPPNTSITGTIYEKSAFLYFSVESVEEFEENTISKLSDMFNIPWKRTVSEDVIYHSVDLVIDEGEYDLYLTVSSKPTESCRIVKVSTGKVKKTKKWVEVEEAEFEYVVECSDD